MKLFIFMLIELLTYAAASDEFSMQVSVKKIKPKDNEWLKITVSSEKTVEDVEVMKEIDMNDGFTIEFRVTNEDGDELTKGGGPFCSHPATREGTFVTLLGRFLGINLECPVREKKGDKPEAEQFGKVILDEDPGDKKIYIDISVVKDDVSIVDITLRGKGT